MLDLPRYLLGVADICLLAGFAWLGASALRSRLLPAFSGAPAYLATSVLALSLLIWTAELLGTFGLFQPVPYLGGVVVVGVGLRLGVGGGWGCPSRLLGFSPGEVVAGRGGSRGEKQDAAAREGHPHPPSDREPRTRTRGNVAVLVGLAVAAVAVVKFAAEAKMKLGTGMTGFDSTWYHGPFAAEFFQSGDTWQLHYIAPQFLAWFYPANAEIFHAVGMLAFDRDLLSPLLNLGWFVGCLVACWCIGRPYGVAPWSLALGAVALSVPALSDQAGEARNDIVGTFFLLAAAAIALNPRSDGVRLSGGVLAVTGLAAGMAAGTKLNFLLPAGVLVVGLAIAAGEFVPHSGKKSPSWSGRGKALAFTGMAAVAGGGYWYLRNLFHAGNPLPWVDQVGPVALPAPDQALGGREGRSVLGYLTDGSIWSDWFLPGLHNGLWAIWPLVLLGALVGLVLCLVPIRSQGKRSEVDGVLVVTALTGLAAILAWLVAPTSASGPEGIPRGFESGLRYLAPALILGLAVLPPALLPRVARWRGSPIAQDARSASEHMGEGRRDRTRGPERLRDRTRGPGRPRDRTRGPLTSGRRPLTVGAVALIAAIAIGYPVQRHYLDHRYADPSFSEAGLNAAFAWARDVSNARIATTATRQYPLYGTDLSNHVQYVGTERPHGGFVAPSDCRSWRRLLNAADYDYVVVSRDRLERTQAPYPPTARWTEGPGAEVLLRKAPTVIFRLVGSLDPARCRY